MVYIDLGMIERGAHVHVSHKGFSVLVIPTRSRIFFSANLVCDGCTREQSHNRVAHKRATYIIF